MNIDLTEAEIAVLIAFIGHTSCHRPETNWETGPAKILSDLLQRLKNDHGPDWPIYTQILHFKHSKHSPHGIMITWKTKKMNADKAAKMVKSNG